MSDLYADIDDVKTFRDLYNIPWQYFAKERFNSTDKEDVKNLDVLIVNLPCMGFGDIVFAMKLQGYIKEWYHCNVVIATTQPDKFIQLGQSKDSLILLKGKSKIDQCRKLGKLKSYSMDGKKITLPIFDIIFFAPLTADFDVDHEDIKTMIPYSNKFNTFFFSEYNDKLTKKSDFQTGIGKGRLGLFFTKINAPKKLKQIKHPYAVIYLNADVIRINACSSGFIELVCKKYDFPKFDIVVPPWIGENFKKYQNSYIKAAEKYYDTIILVTKKGSEIIIDGDGDNILYIRADILPLANKDMLSLIKHSVDDILLTGDQSITDTLSCCSRSKNIFYQIAPWKEDLGRNLSIELPNKYLTRKSTSCGTLTAINYDSDYAQFMKQWDFRRLARYKMNGIMLAAVDKHDRNIFNTYEYLVLSSNTLESFFKKINLIDIEGKY